MVTRRDFIGGAAASAAAVVLGIKPDKTVHTKLGMYFFGPDPIIFDARLRADEAADLFAVEVLHEKDRVVAHLSLSAIKKAVASPGKAVPADVLIWKDGGRRAEEDEIKIIAQKCMLTFRGPGDEAAPVWLPIDDVRPLL